MIAWSRLRAVVRRWRRPASWEGTLHHELQSYLDHEIDARVADGMSAAEARRSALAEFGGVEQVKERVREGATGAWFDAAGQDIRYACRALIHSPRFAISVVGSLAIGMAVTVAALAFLNTLLFRPFPAVTDQERLVRVSVSRNCGRPDCWTRMSSPRDFAMLRDDLAGLEGLAGYTLGQVAAAVPEALSLRSALASADYFTVLGVRPALGRVFDSADEASQARVVVIAHSLWTRQFGADPAAIGRSIRVGDEVVQIVGVAPAFFIGVDAKLRSRGPDVWLPLWLADRVAPLTRADARRQERDLLFIGRLRDGVDLRRLRAEAALVAPRLAAQRGEGSRVGMADVQRVWMSNPDRRGLTVGLILPVPLLVLMIACINAASLMLARGSQRRREIAVRLAIGAGRGRIVRQLLIESGILCLVATAIALPLAWSGLHVIGTPLGVPIPLDVTVLSLTVMAAVAATVTSGLAPALRVTAEPPSRSLGPVGMRGDALPRDSRLRRGLIVAQVAVSLGLLATAWQLVATIRSQGASGGTPADRLLIAQFDLQPLALAAAETERFYSELLAGAARLPGVEAVGLAHAAAVGTPGQGAAAGSIRVWTPEDRPTAGRVTLGGYASGDLFGALGLRLVQGRGFVAADQTVGPQVAVVNQTFAKTIAGPAVGSTLRVAARDGDYASALEVRIAGVVDAVLEPRATQDEPAAARVYLPSRIEAEPALALYVRTRESAVTVAQPVRELVRRTNQRVPVLELGSLEELTERAVGPQLWLARAAWLLGVIGVLLATAGLYGVASYVVAMRSREIAIRMALGARPHAILTMMLGQSMRMAFIGLLAGGAVAVVVSRLIRAEYHGMHGLDRAAFGGAATLFLAAMFLASALPAVRASRVDPVANLKDG